MSPGHRRSIRAGFLMVVAAGVVRPPKASGQDLARRLATQAIDESRTVTLRDSVHPLAQSRFDRGAVPDSFAADRMLLMLNRPAEREAALRQFLLDVHDRGPAGYHKWVTPEQFGQRFGPADSDIQTATAWLSSHGFRVARVTKSKGLIEFSGSAGKVKEAFHSEIHQYRINNENHYANAFDLAIPEALAPLIRGVSPMNDFHLKPYVRRVGPASYSGKTGKATPLPTGTNEIGIGTYFTIAPDFFAIGPKDFATQYNLTPLSQSGIRGAGQTIGIIGGSNIDLALVNAYRQLFHLSDNAPHIVIDGGDPGIGPLPDSDLEAYLDVELSGAVAPDATVNLYISDGSQVQDPINLATIRAIEDNQASVLSLSLGACEAVLGPFGNQLWASLWEQAAAQGQTILVSSGDTGSAGCDFGGEAATRGLAVSGVASTPWNVAVGGTDFFYANYTAGTSSAAAPFWNQTNDSGDGSLIAPVTEQAWDGPLGLNILRFPDSIEAGGGGASSCVQSTTTSTGVTTCLGGYPKPAWQAAPGVPNDAVRDLPDVSLFASNGANLSAYAICAEVAEDCVIAGGNQPQVTLVGGTSASAPAMAGILALVNQKFGRQGQADFTLYALARKSPAVFHDIVKGSNNLPCRQGTPNCSLDTNGDGLFTLQEYPAGSAYDLATGLGSVDASALVTNWNGAAFLGTTTTLSLSSSSIVHGTPVTLTASVTAPPGSGIPTGDVAVITTSGFPLQRNESIPITNGTASGTVDFFPGGTYQVGVQYWGDAVFAPSASAPVQISVAPEPSTIFFNAFGPTGVVTNTGAQTTYGQRWIFTAEPYGMNGDQIFGLATGSVTFTDGAASQQVPINSQGVAGYSPSTLSVGTHNLMLSYAGDASYQASTAGPFTFTVAKGNPNIMIPSVESAVPTGGSLLVNVVIGTGFGAAPTGDVSITLGSTTGPTTLVVPLTSVYFDTLPYATATATFSSLQTGSFSLVASYSGDGNWNSATVPYQDQIVVAPSTRMPSATSISVFPASISRFESSSFTATVLGSVSGPAPTGSVRFYVNGQALFGRLDQNGPSSSEATLDRVQATEMTNGADQVIAVYSGDSVYNPSTSAPATVNVDLGTFSLTLGVPRIAILSGQSATVPVVLTAVDGFSAPFSLSCAPSSASIGCAVNPTTTTSASAPSAMLTVNAYTLTGGQAVSIEKDFLPQIPRGGITSMGLLLFLVIANAVRRLPLKWRLAFSFCAIALLLAGCGTSSSVLSPPPPPVKTAATPGSYSVLVRASASGTIRNVTLIVVVQ